jgi:hypothetical protein
LFSRGAREQKRLSRSETAAIFRAYAESDRAQQDSKVSLETIQDHRDGQSHAATRFAPAFAFVEECET